MSCNVVILNLLIDSWSVTRECHADCFRLRLLVLHSLNRRNPKTVYKTDNGGLYLDIFIARFKRSFFPRSSGCLLTGAFAETYPSIVRVVKLWQRVPTPPLDVFKRQLDLMLSELFPDAPCFASSTSLSLQFTVSTIIHNHNNVIPLPDVYGAYDFCCDPFCHEALVLLLAVFTEPRSPMW